jgi:hypothetical protein
MSEFEGKAENICSHRVLLSLTLNDISGVYWFQGWPLLILAALEIDRASLAPSVRMLAARGRHIWPLVIWWGDRAAKRVDPYCFHRLGNWEPRLNEMPSLRVILRKAHGASYGNRLRIYSYGPKPPRALSLSSNGEMIIDRQNLPAN